MALETQFNVEKFTGNGVAREWALSFPALKPEHIYLVITDEVTGKITAVDPALYEVRGVNTPHVSVVYPLSGLPLPSGKKLTVYRLVPHIQPTDFENNDAFLAEVVEWEFDHIVMQIQQLREMIERAIKVPIGSDKTAEDLLAELLEAAEAADRAEAAADRAEAAAELTELNSSVKNKWRCWTVTAAEAATIAETGILQLPTPYYPGRDMVLLAYEGTLCFPKDERLVNAYQFEDIGDVTLDNPSYQLRVFFDIAEGDEIAVWVISSNAWRVQAYVEALVEKAVKQVATATEQAVRASGEAVAALESRVAAETAQAASEIAAAEARAKADAILDLEVATVTLPPDEDADATYDPETGVLTLSLPKGETGEQGTGIQIKGTAETPEALPAQGGEGDVYLVGNETDGFVLYVWDIAAEAWHNGGTLGVTLSDSLTSGASTTAASSKAVKAANDNALAAQDAAAAASVSAEAAMAAIPQLSDSIDSDDTTTAASSAAVKEANDNALEALDVAQKPPHGSIRITTSGSWTPPSLGLIRVQAIGGGGGGGGGIVSPGIACGGASSGQYIDTIIKLESLDPIDIVIGAGGAGGYNTNNGAGGNGGNTSFGAYFTASGGRGSSGVIYTEAPAAIEGREGAWGNGSGSVPGYDADGFYYFSPDYPYIPTHVLRSGNGASSPLGGGGFHVSSFTTTAKNGNNATGYGAGGGGAIPANGQWARGGAGSPGVVIIDYLGW